MTQREQELMERGEQPRGDASAFDPGATGQIVAEAPLRAPLGDELVDAERGARASLRGQIDRLERQLSEIVAAGFPRLAPPAALPSTFVAPGLPGLAELERQRDGLVARLRELQTLARARADHERRAREQLRRMKLEPGRYRFVRLPVSELGEGGCGVWEVRPRYGLIGMLAGWWELTLSSGCPLARGLCSTHGPGQRSAASPQASGADAR